MKTRRCTGFFIGLTLFLSLFLVLTSCKAADVGISKIVDHPALNAVEKGIMDELRESGKSDLVFDFQNAAGDMGSAKRIALKFNSDKVKVAVGIATPTAQTLAGTLEGIPVVFSAVTDPVGAGLLDSATDGDEWVTGVSDLTPVADQVALLNRIKPVKVLGNIYSSNEDNSVTISRLLKEACDTLGITVIDATVTNTAEVKQAVESIIDLVDAVYISTDNTVVSALGVVAEAANRKGIPLMSADPSSAMDLPVLAAYGFNYYEMGRITGKMVGQILDGAQPADMPVQYVTDPAAMDFLFNRDVAEQIGLEWNQEIVDSATILVQNGEALRMNMDLK
jgi:putative ABC transport system substrate-binding protein